MTAWRIFDTLEEAERYELGVWLGLLRARAAEGDGTLTKTGAKRDRVDLAARWPADALQIAASVDLLDRTALDALKVETAELPLFGRRADGQVTTTEGRSVRWSDITITADGRHAVVATPGDPEATTKVEWPPVEPMP